MLKKNNNFSNLIIFIIVNLFFYTNCFALENKVVLEKKDGHDKILAKLFDHFVEPNCRNQLLL